MITFLPYPDFAESVHCLDTQRLNKQRSEVLWILNALHLDNDAAPRMRNHPAVLMWEGFEPQLCEYGLLACEEWLSRGHNDGVKAEIEWHLEMATAGDYSMEKPPWFGDKALHESHQSNLLRKNPAHCGKFFDGVPDNLPYYWPVRKSS